MHVIQGMWKQCFFLFLKKKKEKVFKQKKKSASVLIKVSAKVPADRKPLSLGQAIVWAPTVQMFTL